MNPDDHERARRLIAQSAIEGCGAADNAWLDSHLARCAECAREARALANVLASLRELPVEAPPALVNRTRLAVRRRSAGAAQQEQGSGLLWAALALSAIWMAASLRFAWWTCEWLGQTMGVPAPVWQACFLASWFFPATLAAAVLAWRRPADDAGFLPEEAWTS